MSEFPNVNVEILNNQLGRVTPTQDGVAALVLFGPSTSEIGLTEPKLIFSLEDAEDLGLNAAYDTAQTTDVYQQIKEFYDRAGRGSELYIMLVAKTTTMASACDKANNIVKLLLNFAQGRIRLLGITRTPDGAYDPTFVDGIDDDVNAAVLNLHSLLQDFALEHKPCRALVGARAFQGDVGDLRNFRLNTNNRVGVVLGSTTDDGNPAVGFALGQFANRPVQRKIGRVRSGDVGLDDAYFTDGSETEDYELQWPAIHNKGFIFFRKFPNRNGYFFNDDPSCSPVSDDYSSLARGRVIDKAHVITFQTFVEEIQDDIFIDDDGFMDPSVVKDYQQRIESAIGEQMVPAEASNVRCVINPAQNVLATDKIKIKKLGVRPRGYSSIIDIPLGFDNPFNQE